MGARKVEIKPSRKKGESKVEINLSNDLNIYTIEEIKDDILEAVNKYDNIQINSKEINNMDLTFVQLLNSIQKTVKETQKNLSLNIELNEETKELFDNTDLTKIIKI